MAVTLIDPNTINVNRTPDANNVPFVNGIPQYQDMYIYVELTAKSKGRTVIVTTNSGNISHGVLKTGLSVPQYVNFMGVNQIDLGTNQQGMNNNPNYLKFTTNYYDGSTGNYTQFESFGINNIKITINSSFIPQIDIQFIDVRGLSFFNQATSPYRILFDFPPPIFELTVKGYYGKALQYQLHLVKYTSEFQSETGNFVIDAQFVAVTFAPLSDVLFRYVINTPLIPSNDTGISATPSTDVAPQNTNDLITKLKNLYTTVNDKIKTSSDSKAYDDATRNINAIDDVISILANYKINPNLQNIGAGTPYLITKISDLPPLLSPNPNEVIDNVLTLSDYNIDILQNGQTASPVPINKRLFVMFINQINTSTKITIGTVTIDTTADALKNFRAELIQKAKTNIDINETTLNNDISAPFHIFNYNNVYEGKILTDQTDYIGIDVTNFYVDLFKKKNDIINEQTLISKNLATKINAVVMETLGMMPTIYNIFKIILDDVDNFFSQLKKVSNTAENDHNIPANKNIILGNNYKEGTNYIYSFPLIVDIEKTVCSGTKRRKNCTN